MPGGSRAVREAQREGWLPGLRWVSFSVHAEIDAPSRFHWLKPVFDTQPEHILVLPQVGPGHITVEQGVTLGKWVRGVGSGAPCSRS